MLLVLQLRSAIDLENIELNKTISFCYRLIGFFKNYLQIDLIDDLKLRKLRC